jgi:hypothetical protein
VVGVVTNSELDETARFLMAGQKLAPGRHDFGNLLAQVYLRQQNFAAARKVLERIARNPNAAEHERANAQASLTQIEAIEARIAEVKRQGGTVVFESGGSSAPPANGGGQGVTFEMGKPTIKKRTEGEQVRGMLWKVDCPGGESAVFHVKALDGGRSYKLHAATLGQIDLVAYAQDAGSEITCGVRQPENLVIVTFRPPKRRAANSTAN